MLIKCGKEELTGKPTPPARMSACRLRERFGNHPFVGEVRGRGLFQGLELVADCGTKEPFDPARN
jgi:4-aminobutyrate aminotransferase-like enzyme